MRPSSYKLTSGVIIHPIHGGVFVKQEKRSFRFGLGIKSEEIENLCLLLKRGVLLQDLLYLFPTSYKRPIVKLLRSGTQQKWLVRDRNFHNNFSTNYLNRESLRAAFLHDGHDQEMWLPRSSSVDGNVFFYNSQQLKWLGLRCVQKYLQLHTGFIGVFSVGAHRAVITVSADVSACLECVTKWYLGTQAFPSEEDKTLRRIIANAGEAEVFSSVVDERLKELISSQLNALQDGKSIYSLDIVAPDGGMETRHFKDSHPSCSEPRHNQVRPIACNEEKTDILDVASNKNIVSDFRIKDIGIANSPSYYFASAAINSAFRTGFADLVYCFGDGDEKEIAATRCIGECLERFALFHSKPNHIVTAPYHEIISRSLPLRYFNYYTEEQVSSANFKYSNVAPNEYRYWTEAFDIETDQTVMVPLELFFPPIDTNIKPLLRVSTTGTAVHTSKELAVRSAILEVVERDAIALLFLKKRYAEKLSLRTFGKLEAQIEVMQSHGFSVVALNITTDLEIPVILFVAFRVGEKKPNFLKGAAAETNYIDAAHHAFRELWRSFLFYHEKNGNTVPTTNTVNENSVLYNIAYYQTSELREEIRFIYDLDDSVDNPQEISGLSENSLTQILRKLSGRGMRALYREYPLPNNSSRGLCCVKVVIPQLMPLNFGREPWCLGHSRLHANERTEMGEHDSVLSNVNSGVHFFS